MKVLDTMTAKGAWLATLSVGTDLKVAFCNISGQQDSDDPTYDAEIIAQNPDEHQADVLVSIEGVTGGHVATLYYSDGESLHTADPRDGGERLLDGGYFSIADEQPDHGDAEIEQAATEAHEEITGTIEPEPEAKAGTSLTIGNLPKGPAWLLEQATILDAEAKKYRDYSPPHQSLSGAASALRSAVGHVLAGGCEKVPTDKPAPF
jgi:hypothetical protein